VDHTAHASLNGRYNTLHRKGAPITFLLNPPVLCVVLCLNLNRSFTNAVSLLSLVMAAVQ